MLLGYNTNGFAHHRIEDAIEILAGIGYRSVAITLEHDLLEPPEERGVARCVEKLAPLLAKFDLQATIETGARFILDPRRKHQPTLISACAEDRTRRIAFVKAAIDVAAALSAGSVSLWSGAPDDDASVDVRYERLVASLRELCDYAAARSAHLSFEPEPGMFIETMPDFERLFDAVDRPAFGLTLDVGHVHCLNDGDCGEHIHRWRDHLYNVHIEDMKRGVHEHLLFGDGEMDFPAMFKALTSIEYTGPVHVELSRHSHNAVNVARRSHDFLTAFAD